MGEGRERKGNGAAFAWAQHLVTRGVGVGESACGVSGRAVPGGPVPV